MFNVRKRYMCTKLLTQTFRCLVERKPQVEAIWPSSSDVLQLSAQQNVLLTLPRANNILKITTHTRHTDLIKQIAGRTVTQLLRWSLWPLYFKQQVRVHAFLTSVATVHSSSKKNARRAAFADLVGEEQAELRVVVVVLEDVSDELQHGRDARAAGDHAHLALLAQLGLRLLVLAYREET